MSEDTGEYSWNRSQDVRGKYFNSSINKEPRYQGRLIIERDSPIDGRVYLGIAREAIVVDGTKQSELQSAYDELIKRRQAKVEEGQHFREGILREVFDLTGELLPTNQQIVDQVSSQYKDGGKVALANFIRAKGGVCRHQSLLAAYLLERLINEGRIRGKVSVDRSFNRKRGTSHAWVRYTSYSGQVYILDVTKNYLGKIEQADDPWSYKRPEIS